LELDDAIPHVAVDFESVKRVFMNCALNAIEAMETGGVLTITTRPAELTETADGTPRARAVRIGFRDTGPGIPESERQRIFTPFFTTKREGHGLGLALVHKTVTDHGGRVQLHSREHVGTEFIILLPVKEQA
jgi:signal transduction histidine kinase